MYAFLFSFKKTYQSFFRRHCVDIEYNQSFSQICYRLVIVTKPLFDEVVKTTSQLIRVVFCFEIFCEFLFTLHFVKVKFDSRIRFQSIFLC